MREWLFDAFSPWEEIAIYTKRISHSLILLTLLLHNDCGTLFTSMESW